MWKETQWFYTKVWYKVLFTTYITFWKNEENKKKEKKKKNALGRTKSFQTIPKSWQTLLKLAQTLSKPLQVS